MIHGPEKMHKACFQFHFLAAAGRCWYAHSEQIVTGAERRDKRVVIVALRATALYKHLHTFCIYLCIEAP